MKALSVNDRPREKLFRLGAAGLGDNELVAIVLGNGSRSGNALSVANEVLETTGGLHGIPRASVDELRRIDGMGLAKAHPEWWADLKAQGPGDHLNFTNWPAYIDRDFSIDGPGSRPSLYEFTKATDIDVTCANDSTGHGFTIAPGSNETF